MLGMGEDMHPVCYLRVPRKDQRDVVGTAHLRRSLVRDFEIAGPIMVK